MKAVKIAGIVLAVLLVLAIAIPFFLRAAILRRIDALARCDAASILDLSFPTQS